MIDKDFYVKALRSEECACEKGKAPGKTLCFSCFKALPGDRQRDLYRPIADTVSELLERVYQAQEG
ncbi:MAG: hypothetical protein JRK53_17415 [Deltaproteobacteria bacterium]|nr:hypothetical protein [Deltaproteobacteria bacterium]